MRLTYLEEARFEYLEAAAYYEKCQTGLGLRFSLEMESAETEILHRPFLCRDLGKGIRRKMLNRFPYGLLFHLPEPGWIEIIAVMHLHREPGYWSECA
jgi:hypothetical protein